ncbi:MAG: hypothetical protein GX622_03200 [Bacteroidales bacterium]|nr:hypothetical protein [Bacteroidales bacterium]
MRVRTIIQDLLVLSLLIFGGAFPAVYGQEKGKVLQSEKMRALVTADGLVSVTDPSDRHGADIISNRAPWGRIKIVYRSGDGPWIERPYDRPGELIIEGNRAVLESDHTGDPVTLRQSFSLDGNVLHYEIEAGVRQGVEVEIGDLALYLPWSIARSENPDTIFERSFTKHHFISGNGSFLYFTRPSGEPPFLMILAAEGTGLEYFDGGRGGYKVYMHSAVAGNSVPSGTWRQPHTSVTLGGDSGRESLKYRFRIAWADSWDMMRQLLYDEGLFDIRVVPGMTIPTDLKAQFSLHTMNQIDSIVPEHPGDTDIRYLGEKLPGHHLYEVSFRRLGENLLTVHYGGKQKTYLEFFATEPLETLVKKRSSFIVNSTQHRDTTKWYNGLFSAYDMKNGILRGPDNTDGFDGWWGYVLACDDPGLCKAPYVAAKNVFYPDRQEIEAVEYYLKNFVWNGLQRTDTDDPYPYGIYGVPNWKVARDPVERAKIRHSNLDKMKIWRSYDYPHVTMLYYHMYQIARMYPDMVHYLDAAGYLERAWQTARAYFIYPYEILPWYETYKWGCYNELVIENLIADLKREGRQVEADWLRAEYEKKVKYFIYDDRYPFRSEYAIDRTAFESSYAFAKYGTLNEMEPDTNLWFDKNDSVWYSHSSVTREAARDFMERQHYAGLAVRGWLEAKYFLLGSDFTYSSDNHCLSYMARMGGWSVLDYAIRFAEKPYDWLQLGYASYLAPYALMNTGTEESDYGYWYPGKERDGAMGWAFMESKTGRAWIRKNIDRGAWYYDGEADLGNGAIFRTAQTVLADDPLFGWIAYGGTLATGERSFLVEPRDGVRARFSAVTTDRRFTIELERDGFAEGKEIEIDRSMKRVTFALENRSGDDHQTRMIITSGRGAKIRLDGKRIRPSAVKNGTTIFELSVSSDSHMVKMKIRHRRHAD